MNIEYEKEKTKYGPGVDIHLDGVEVAIAIDAWLAAQNIHIVGPKIITVNGQLCDSGNIYIDPSGHVIANNKTVSGRGPLSENKIKYQVQCCVCDEFFIEYEEIVMEMNFSADNSVKTIKKYYCPRCEGFKKD